MVTDILQIKTKQWKNIKVIKNMTKELYLTSGNKKVTRSEKVTRKVQLLDQMERMVRA
jgi:hypothetical protein